MSIFLLYELSTFSNVYLNEFDHFMKRDLKIKYYGRYVNDFILIHNDKEYLKSVIPDIFLHGGGIMCI